MSEKIKHQIVIGNEIFEVEVKAKKNEGKVLIEIDSLLIAQKKLAHDLILERVKYDRALFNYVLSVLGESGASIAKYLEVTPAAISQFRKGQDCSSPVWKLFRITVLSLLRKTRDREIDKIVGTPRSAA